LLADSRPAVRTRALHTLGKAGAAAVPALAQALKTMSSPEARANVVWALTRVQAQPARAATRLALADPAELVRQAAIHSAGLWRDLEAAPHLETLLES